MQSKKIALYAIFLYLSCTLFATSISTVNAAAGTAKKIYAGYQDSIYQIRVIELASGNKSSIGSGFLISQQGHVATNYHVVAHKIQHPDQYRLEYVLKDGSKGDLKVLSIDVVHDLAITIGDLPSKNYIKLGSEILSKGTRIYSLGNPRDLGMSVIEGTYNGLLDKSLYDKIFFSGSLNPGMSGGPTLDRKGNVIGVNVSTAGNQLSFLVPVKYLKKMVAQLKNSNENNDATDGEKEPPNFDQQIEQQLIQIQTQNINNLINSKWESTTLGGMILPGKINKIFKCWGDSDNDKEAIIGHAYSHCMSEDKIYISQNLTTGSIRYRYDLFQSKDLGTLHFYNLYKYHFGRAEPVNYVGKEDVGNYVCNVEFTLVAEKNWKLAFCARNYKKYPLLFDISVQMALISEYYQGLVIQIAVSGITKQQAMKFVKHFMKEIRWQG